MTRRGQYQRQSSCSGCDPTQRRVVCVRTIGVYVEFDGSFSRVWWGDGSTDVGRVDHTYTDGMTEHKICIEPLNGLTEFRIINGFVVGRVPDFLDFSGTLELINLNINQLTGEIPPELGNLENLTNLNLRNNQLTGEIPPELGNLASLEVLNIRFNRLTGEIPPELGNLENLTNLNLRNNQLTGEIPPELGNLASLEVLNIRFNRLTGEIPPELGNLASLEQFRLNDNQLSGAIPGSIASINALLAIALHENSFSQADMSNFVNDMWINRATLGGNGCLINVSGNNGLTTQAIDQINGTGAYAGDGLTQAGCNVLY